MNFNNVFPLLAPLQVAKRRFPSRWNCEILPPNENTNCFDFTLLCASHIRTRAGRQGTHIVSLPRADPLPPRATRLCGLPPAADQDGMPVVFSAQIDASTVSASAFAVETSSGNVVTPLCATLRPAVEILEQRTVLLIGEFSPGDALPINVEIVGLLEDTDGNSLTGLRSEQVTALAAGPSLVLAERFAPDSVGLERECPEPTAQAIQLTWQGGVTGPEGANLAEPQRTAISVLLENGDLVHPFALGDDDPDNHVIACVSETSVAIEVSVAAGFFYDPGDDPNPATNTIIIE